MVDLLYRWDAWEYTELVSALTNRMCQDALMGHREDYVYLADSH